MSEKIVTWSVERESIKNLAEISISIIKILLHPVSKEIPGQNIHVPSSNKWPMAEKYPLRWNSPCRDGSRSSIRIFIRVRQRGELNWALQFHPSGQQTCSTVMSRPEWILVR